MATSDSPGLLSKVVSFVSKPALRRPPPDETTAADPNDDGDKAMIQAMMDRKLHNDIVRKREFELLRQMRKRGPQASRIDLNDRASQFPASALSQPGGRAQTIKKIDEIEQQMSQQWWKGKQLRAAFQTVKPPVAAAPKAPTPDEPMPEPPEMVVVPSAPPPPSPSPVVAPGGTIQGRLEASLFDEPSPSGPVEFQPTQAEQFTHEPEIEDAAILFANGDFDGAAQSLMALLREGDVRGEQEDIWMTLFDLYRSIGDRTRFDGAAIDFAARFGRSAPQWGTVPEIQQRQLAPEIQLKSAGKGTDWTFPAVITPATLTQLKAVLDAGAAPWRLDWTQVQTVEEAAVPEMAQLFSQWCASKVQLRFVGAQHLDELLRAATPSGQHGVAQAWWLWRLDSLRLTRREDDFELAALDYCITYEMSPPAWEPAACDYAVAQPTTGPSEEAAPLALGEDLLNTLAGAYPGLSTATSGFHTMTADRGTTAGAAHFGLAELSGEVLGDAAPVLETLEHSSKGFNKLVIDCRQLVRVDFPAAGGLLNWTAARVAEGCKVEFKNVNRLVATFFSVVGITEYARLIPPSH